MKTRYFNPFANHRGLPSRDLASLRADLKLYIRDSRREIKRRSEKLSSLVESEISARQKLEAVEEELQRRGK